MINHFHPRGLEKRRRRAARYRARACSPCLEMMEDRTLLAGLVFGDAALGSTVSIQTQKQTEVLDGLDGAGQTTKENKLDTPGYSYAIFSVDRPEDQSSINLGVTSRGGFSFKSLQIVSQSVHLTSDSTPGSVNVEIVAGPGEAKGDAVKVNLDFSFKVTGYGAINAETEAKYGAGYVYKGATTKLAAGDDFIGRGYADDESSSFDAKIGDTFTLYLDDVVTAKSTPDYHFGQVGYWTDLALNVAVIKKPPDIQMRNLDFNGSGSSFRFQYNATGGTGPFAVGLYYSPTTTFDITTAVPVLDPDSGQPATETINPVGGATGTFNFSRPPVNPSHLGYLLAVADPDNKISESDKINNTTWMQLPDITIASVKWRPSPETDWEAKPKEAGGVTINYMISGHDLPVGARVALYWSQGPTPSQGDLPIFDDTAGNPFTTKTGQGPNHLYVSAASLGDPPAGSKYLIAVADWPDLAHSNGLMLESDESNNERNPLMITQESILSGSVHYTAKGNDPGKIWAKFMPAPGDDPPAPEQDPRGALRLDQAEALLGVASFNWVQTMTLPEGWEAFQITLSRDPGKVPDPSRDQYSTFVDHGVYAAGNIKPGPGKEIDLSVPPYSVVPTTSLGRDGIPDPLIQTGTYNSDGRVNFMVYFDATLTAAQIQLPSADPASVTADDWIPPDAYPFYYDLGKEVASHVNKSHSALGFFDAPTVGQEALFPGQYVQFSTRLVGVQENNDWAPWSEQVWGTKFLWSTDAKSPLVVSFFKFDNPAWLPPVVSGGVRDVTFDRPPRINSSSDIFQATRNFPVKTPKGGDAEAIAAGDFNGDGHQDILMSFINAGNGLYVLPGRGDGIFGQPIASAANESFTTLAVADFNGDGKPDVAAAVTAAEFVSVLLGQGDGTFGSESQIQAGQGIDSIVAADFDGDGKTDMATANDQSKDVTVLLNTGGGTFRTAVSYPTVGTSPFALVSVDFNGDGKTDLAVLDGSYTGRIDVFLNKGDGTFNAARSFVSLTGGVYHLAAGDIDGDGKTDLVISDNVGGKGVHVMYGQGDGTFLAPVMLAAVPYVQHIYAGDLNQDGKADIAARTPTTTVVLLSNGRGQAPARSEMIVATAPEDRALPAFVAADFNGDNHPDLATSNRDARTASVLLNRGDGTFPSAVIEPLALGDDYQPDGSRVLGDFNGDGRPDIAISSYSSNLDRSRIDVLLSQGDGGHTMASTLMPATFSYVSRLATGNFDGDGKLDLVVHFSRKGKLAVLRGNGDGTFTINPIPTTFRRFMAIAAGDFNADGLDDIAATEIAENLHGPQLDLFMNQGGGRFGDPLVIPGDGSDLQSLAVVDFDGDSKLDLAVVSLASFDGGSTSILLGNGDETFRSKAQYPGNATDVSVADVNGDGKPDLIVLSRNSDSFRVLPNLGGGTFGPALVTQPGAGIFSVSSGDFNQDGHLDVIASGTYGDALLLGKGDGTFGDPVYYATGPSRVGAVIDYDGDGKPDFVVPRDKSFTTTGPVLTILKGTFAPPPVTLTLTPIADRTVSERQTVSLTASATDSASGHRLTYSLDPGAPAGATIDPTTGAFSFAATSGPATHAITVRVTDADSPAVSTTQTFLISVSDVAPALSVGGDATGLSGVLFTRDGSFADPGTETWAASVDYGDDLGPQPLGITPEKTFHLQHVFAKAGTYRVSVVVSDAGGKSGSGAFSVNVATPQPSQVEPTASSAVVREADGRALFAITRSGDTRGTATIQYTTEDGTALAGADYLATSGTLIFGPGESSKTIAVDVLDDTVIEGPETFQIHLIGTTGTALGTVSVATVTIADSTNFGRLEFTAPAVVVREGSAQATVHVARSGGTDGEVTVHYQTTDGSARGGMDYVAASGTLTFEWSAASQDIIIPLLHATALEADKSFTLTLSDPGGGAVLGPTNQAVVTIAKQKPGVLSFQQPSYAVDEDGGQAVLTVTRTGGTDGSVSVEVVTIAGDAQPGVHFVPVVQTLTFAPGETSKTVSVPVLDDRHFGPDRRLSVALRDPTGGATLGGLTTATLVVRNTDPAPLVTMTNVRLITKKRKKATNIVITLSGPVDPARASLAAAYRLATAGKRGSFDARNSKTIKIKASSYDATSNTVTITPKRPFKLRKTIQLRVSGVGPLGLTDGFGRAIDGDRDGRPGGNATALLQ